MLAYCQCFFSEKKNLAADKVDFIEVFFSIVLGVFVMSMTELPSGMVLFLASARSAIMSGMKLLMMFILNLSC